MSDQNWISAVQLFDSAVVESVLKAPKRRVTLPTRKIDVRIGGSFEEKPDAGDERVLICMCSLDVEFSFHTDANEGPICSGSCKIAGATSSQVPPHSGELTDKEQQELVWNLRRETLDLVYSEARGHVEHITASSTAGKRILPAINAEKYLDTYMST